MNITWHVSPETLIRSILMQPIRLSDTATDMPQSMVNDNAWYSSFFYMCIYVCLYFSYGFDVSMGFKKPKGTAVVSLYSERSEGNKVPEGF